ncbi:MAG: thiamine pyrophosphate-binding protein [Acidobacteria bacterium]|nr:thiamine pyrophosphate-binding protein [Acidobacteriota bacterium]
MREMASDLLSGKINRRAFVRRMAGAGFSLVAAKSAADSLEPLALSGISTETKTFAGTGGELLAKQLLAAGTKFIFVANSSGMGALADAVIDHPKLRFIQAVSENQVVGMADGYAKASGSASFSCFSRVGGPMASANMYNAMKDRTPVVILTDHADSMADGRDGHEDLDDWLSPYKEFTKWRWIIKEGDRIPQWVSHAFKVSSTAPGGPSFVRIPRNVLYQRHKAEIFPRESITIPMRLTPDTKTIVEAAKMLVEASSPLMFVGSEVWTSGGRPEIVELAELLGIPVTQAISWSADFPTDHPLFLGAYLNPMRFPGEIDLFLNLGARMPDQGSGPPAIPQSAKIIHARIESEAIGVHYPIDLGIAGCVKETAKSLIGAVKAMLTSERLTAISQARLEKTRQYTEAIRKSYLSAARNHWDASPMIWPRLLHDINRELDRDAIIVPEVGTEDWVNRSFAFNDERKTKFGRTVGRSLGWGVSASIGVKLARPDQQVVALQGDGGFLFGQTDALWSMSRYDAPVIVIVANNRSYDEPRNNILMKDGRCRQENKDMICYLGDPDVDFTQLASAYRIRCERITHPGEIKAAMGRAIEETRGGRPYLIEAMVARTGLGAESTWHPKFSLARARVRKA